MSLVKHATLVGAALAALAFAAPTQAQSVGATAVATTNVNVRSGPGTSNRVVDVLRTGQQVRIVNVSGSWCGVEKSGPDGWVSCGYLAEARDARRPAPAPDRRVRADETPAIANTSVNVRSGPSTRFRVVDGIRRGDRVTIVGRSGSWCDIEKSGPDGWVACRYLTEGRGGNITVRPAPGLSFSFSFGRGDGFSVRPPRDRDGSSRDPVCLVTFFRASQVEGGADADVQRARVLPRAQAEALAARDSRSAVFEYGTPQQTRETCDYLDNVN